MVSNTKITETRRANKKTKNNKRKKQMKNKGTTPKFAVHKK